MAIFLSFVALVFWGASDFFGGFVSKKEDNFTVTYNREVVELGAVVLLLLVFRGIFTWTDFGLGVAAGFIASFSLPTFFRLLASGHMGIVAPVTGTVGASVPVVAGLIGGERPAVLQLVGIALAVLGVALISMVQETEEAKHSSNVVSDVRMAVLCGLGFGTYYIFIHHTSSHSGIWPNVGVSLTMVVVMTCVGLMRRKRLNIKRELWPLNMVGAATDLVAFIAFTYATRGGLLSITAVISSLYPMVTALVAFVVLKESFIRLHKIGLAVSVVSLALISAGG